MNDREVHLPLLLAVARVAGGVFGMFGTAAGLWGLLRIAVGDDLFETSGDLVSTADFRVISIAFLVFYVFACVTAGAASLALWRQQPRSRFLLVALLAEFVIGDSAVLVLANRLLGVGTIELATSVIFFALVASSALWYLFRKASVVGYYEAVRHN